MFITPANSQDSIFCCNLGFVTGALNEHHPSGNIASRKNMRCGGLEIIIHLDKITLGFHLSCRQVQRVEIPHPPG